jgi:hypothetical protein
VGARVGSGSLHGELIVESPAIVGCWLAFALIAEVRGWGYGDGSGAHGAGACC